MGGDMQIYVCVTIFVTERHTPFTTNREGEGGGGGGDDVTPQLIICQGRIRSYLHWHRGSL